MNCPVCTTPLHTVRIENAHYHCCRTCYGIWTDAYLLETIVRHAAPRGLPPQRAKNSAAHPAHMHVDKRRCPSCHRDMERINYCFDSNIFIDTCKACNGVWLDKGKVQQLAAYNNADSSRELAARGLCSEIAKSERTHAALSVNRNWYSILAMMLPLPDPDELCRLPYIAVAIVLLNILAMALYTYMDAPLFFSTMGVNLVKIGRSGMQYTIITYAFAHASYLHLIGNMLFLLACGPIVENEIGHAWFAVLYFLLGVCCILPYIGQDTTLAGASGAISGLMGFTLAAFPLRRIKIITFGGLMELPTAYVFGAWFLLQAIYALFFSLADSRSGVGFAAHIAGFLAGLLLGLLYLRHRKLAAVHQTAS